MTLRGRARSWASGAVFSRVPRTVSRRCWRRESPSPSLGPASAAGECLDIDHDYQGHRSKASQSAELQLPRHQYLGVNHLQDLYWNASHLDIRRSSVSHCMVSHDYRSL